MLPRRHFLCTLGAGLLAGSGFELRRPLAMPFRRIYLNWPQGHSIGARMNRQLELAGVEVITDVRQIERADVLFDVLAEVRDKIVVGRTVSGSIREYQLRLRLRYRVRSREGVELIPEAEMLLTRDIHFNETGALFKESEEGLLFRDMETDLVQQILRRMAVMKLPV